MTQGGYSEPGQWVNGEFLRFRAVARRTAMSAEEFGPIERERYDLDTAGITGEANPEVYQTDPYGPHDSYDRRDDPLMD